MAKAVQAAVAVEDVRRAYYDLPEVAKNWDLWIRSVMIDPNELIVSDDGTGKLFRVPFTVNGTDVTFGEEVEIRVEYVDVAAVVKAAVIKASAKTSLVYGERTESRPNEPTMEDSVSKFDKLRARLGLGSDVPDDAVLAAAEGALDSEEDEKPEGTAPEVPAGDDEPEEETEEPDVAAGTVKVDKATMEQLKADAALGRQAHERQAKNDREAVLSAAVRAGKIPPARKAHWAKLLERDPEGTKAELDALEAGLIPVTEEGVETTTESIAAGVGLPNHWFPELASRSENQGNGSTPVILKVGD